MRELEGIEGTRFRVLREQPVERNVLSSMRQIVTEGSAEQTIAELLKELGAAEAAVAALGPTPEEVREEAAEAERLAKENGMPAKSAKVIDVLLRRWSDFLDTHGDAYGFKTDEGPTIELAVHFQVSAVQQI